MHDIFYESEGVSVTLVPAQPAWSIATEVSPVSALVIATDSSNGLSVLGDEPTSFYLAIGPSPEQDA